jgi:putative addiction module component (TIGR02574 family)
VTLSDIQRRGKLGYDVDMAKTADDLREEVLALPTQERARIASDLLASLDSEAIDEVEIDQLWSAETQRRAAMLESGDAGTLTWSDIQQRFADRRAQRRP